MKAGRTAERFALFFKGLPAILRIYIFIALLAPFLTGSKPWLIHIGGHTYFPAFSASPYFVYVDANGIPVNELNENINWYDLKSDFSIFPPFGYTPGKSDLANANYISPIQVQYSSQKNNAVKEELPFFRRHLLGTGRNGEDVLAGLIAGTRSSLAIGFLSMIIAGFLGLVLGGIAGYLGDDGLKLKRGHMIYILLALLPAWFYAFSLQVDSIQNAFRFKAALGLIRVLISAILFFVILSIPALLKIRYFNSTYLNKSVAVPIDFIIMRMTELFLSLPRLILILTIAAISRPSVSSIILIIGLTSWTEIARLTRAEILKLKSMDFIAAGKIAGLSTRQILTRHLLPNCRPALSVLWIYGVASAIMVETGLSFLGVGVPADTVTWGSIMYSARENFTAWWMVIFPGMTIAFLLVSLNRYGRNLSRAFRLRSRIVNNF